MFLLASVWGASFLFIKRSVQIYNPVQMAMWRMVFATVLYLPIAAAFWSKIDWKRWKALVVVAFCGSAIPNFLFAVAQQHVNSSLAGILNSLTPLFTLIIGVTFFQMVFVRDKILGVLKEASARDPVMRYRHARAMKNALDQYRLPRVSTEEIAYADHGTVDFLMRRMSVKRGFSALSQHISELLEITAEESLAPASRLVNIRYICCQ